VSRQPADVTTVEVATATGPARIHLHAALRPRAALILGHGAGGGIAARDLLVAKDVAVSLGVSVGLVEQPYRVVGRRSPPRAPVLDAAWTSVVSQLREHDLAGLPLIVGGRSSGARVACRTAAATAAVGVLCLAFPVQPAARASGVRPPSRLPELASVEVPVLVVQGSRDPFGMPPAGPGRTVVALSGDHGLKADLPGLAAALSSWLASLLDASVPPPGRADAPGQPVLHRA
jgi:predicted alpha/beta-hydrolase family hydrolase